MKKLLRYWLFLVTLGLFLGGLHIWAVPQIIPVAEDLQVHLPVLYIYLTLLHGIAYSLIWWVWKSAFGKTGFAFLALSLLKLMISVGVLYPYLQAGPARAEAVVLHFMVPYFVFLLLELGATYRLLSHSPPAQDS